MDGLPAVKASARQRARAHATQQLGSMPGRSAMEPLSQFRADADGPPICALTLPQQIADHLGHRIMNGDCPAGSRLKEEQLADTYCVSRGPVREAFRILERRGFVEIVPRHGAHVLTFDPADLAALFSMRAVLFGLAARQATQQGAPALIARLSGQVARLQRSAETMDITAREHAVIAGEIQRLFARFSGNRPLLRVMEEITGRALWRMAWCETPLDFTTRARRRQSARFWGRLLRAVAAGDADGAERIARALLDASRDHMIAAIAARRGGLSTVGTDDAPTVRRARRRTHAKANDGMTSLAMAEAN